MLPLLSLLVACAADAPVAAPAPAPLPAPPPAAPMADVVGVRTAGSAREFTFSVEVRSPDVDCDQYADWWEILTPDGALTYRRILDHSHPTEQPFTRAAGPIPVGVSDVVIVRAHLHTAAPRPDHPDGYGGQALQGSVKTGFAPVDLAPGFAPGLETAAPQPEVCLR